MQSRLALFLSHWDRIRPIAVITSVALLLAEFFPGGYAAPGVFFDIIFLIEFVLRTLSADERYTSRARLIDAAGALPVFSALIMIPELSFLAPISLLRFFRLMRLVGLIRTPAAERTHFRTALIAGALCLFAGLTDTGLRTALTSYTERRCSNAYEKVNRSVGLLSLTLPDVVYFVSAGRIHFRDGTPELNTAHYRALMKSIDYVEIPFSPARSVSAGFRIPDEAVLVRSDGTALIYRISMLSLLLLLIALVSVIMIRTGMRHAPAPEEGPMQLHHQTFFAADASSGKDDDPGISIEGLDDIPPLTEPEAGKDDIDALLKGADDIDAMMKDMKLEDTPDPADTALEASDPAPDTTPDALPDLDAADPSDAAIAEADAPALEEALLDVPDISADADAGIAAAHADGPSVDTETIRRMIDEALADKMVASEQEISRMMKEVAIEAVKISTKSIVEYIKKSLPR